MKNRKMIFLSSFLWLFTTAFDMIHLNCSSSAESAGYSVKGKRDPFVPLISSGNKVASGGILNVENLEELVVEGIVMDGDPARSVVVANGSVMKQNDEIGNVKVLRIEPGGVVFSVNGIEGYRTLYQQDGGKAVENK